MEIKLKIGQYSRCDIVSYSSCNRAGKKSILRIFPTGSKKGKLFTKDLSSLVIRAPYGMRVILCTSDGDDWEDHPYRCMTLIEGVVIPPQPHEPGSLPGIRVPDLDSMDKPSAIRSDESFVKSYPFVKEFSEGTGWCFGRVGSPLLKKNIKMIIFERVAVGESPPSSEVENMARVLLKEAKDSPIFEALKSKAMATLKQKREKNSLDKWLKKL